jgi:hypothetical protein
LARSNNSSAGVTDTNKARRTAQFSQALIAHQAQKQATQARNLPTGAHQKSVLGEFAMPILLWHLPLVIFFGPWDAAVSPSEKRSVEAPLDARLAPETPELPPLRSPAN